MMCFIIKKTFNIGPDIRGSYSNIPRIKVIIKKTLDTATSGGVPELLVFFILIIILTTTRTMMSGP